MLYRQVQSLPGSLISRLMFYQSELGSLWVKINSNQQCLKPGVLKLEHASKSHGGFVKTQITYCKSTISHFFFFTKVKTIKWTVWDLKKIIFLDPIPRFWFSRSRMRLETVVLTSCQVIMLLLSGNHTLKMTAIITQAFILSYKKPRGWQPKWCGSELSGTQGTLNFSFWLPHVSLASRFIMAAWAPTIRSSSSKQERGSSRKKTKTKKTLKPMSLWCLKMSLKRLPGNYHFNQHFHLQLIGQN